MSKETHTTRASLGARLRALRLQRGWTQVELATRAGTDQRVISRAEAGKMSLDLAIRLAIALGGEVFID